MTDCFIILERAAARFIGCVFVPAGYNPLLVGIGESGNRGQDIVGNRGIGDKILGAEVKIPIRLTTVSK